MTTRATDKKPCLSLGVINLQATDGAIFKRTLLCYTGTFMGMYGTVTVTEEMLQAISDRFNRDYAKPKNEFDYPPILKDHIRDVDGVLGRVVAVGQPEDWENPRTGETVKAVFGDLRVDDDEAKGKVEKGKYSQVSISFDDDPSNLGELLECSFVAVEAARGAQALKGEERMNLKELQASNTSLQSKLKNALALHSGFKKGTLAAAKSALANLSLIGDEAKALSEEAQATRKNLKMNVLKAQFKGFVKAGKMEKAEFDKVEFESLCGLDKNSLSLVLKSYENRPVSADVQQIGDGGSPELSGENLSMTNEDMKNAIKLQKEGKKKPALADNPEEEVADKDKPAASEGGDKEGPEMGMEDIDDALSKIASIDERMKKLQDAKEKAVEVLTKLQDESSDDEKDKEGEE